jgi:two-component system osmolarity sensor histidine kinase EnvZ
MKLAPRSLLWRTFLLVGLLMVLSVAAWFAIFTTYEREPRAQQLAQTLVSVANLTRMALITARPEARHDLLRELSDREGIHIYPAEVSDKVKPLPNSPFIQRVQELVHQQLGSGARLALEREGEHALFVSFRIDEASTGNAADEEADYWLALPRERIERVFPLSWLGWGIAALLLSLLGAWAIVFRITRPLKRLEAAARKVGAGDTPPPLTEEGPIEIATVSHAFNQMSASLAQLDQDRVLILAGISHDLRTPLTRLRMGIEMSADDDLRDGMNADVEEMDKTIGQFLDFARSEGGEPPVTLKLDELIAELSAQYQRRGFQVVTAEKSVRSAVTRGRPQALRRAISNLIDNALRYAGSAGTASGTASAIELSIEAMRESNDTAWRIDVRDRGPGIPPEEVARMKRPFTRLDNARSNALGAGLGLAIVERIVRLHDATLDLLPREGGGLIARITLPART